MTKKNSPSQNRSQPAKGNVNTSREDISDNVSHHRSCPTSGKNESNNIMQRSATPPMPDTGESDKK